MGGGGCPRTSGTPHGLHALDVCAIFLNTTCTLGEVRTGPARMLFFVEKYFMHIYLSVYLRSFPRGLFPTCNVRAIYI